MRERPIIFGAESVRAILAGRKTQTRRVVRGFPFGGHVQELRDGTWEHSPDGGFDWGIATAACPYGRPGDRLWVRETWWHLKECRPPFQHGGPGVCVRYEAEIQPGEPMNAYDRRSPIHMPRWASRLTLEVTGVRVERLQGITPEDARAEGHPHVPGTERYPQDVHDEAARDWFMDLWDDINAKRGHPWASNSWVWVVEFRRVEP